MNNQSQILSPMELQALSVIGNDSKRMYGLDIKQAIDRRNVDSREMSLGSPYSLIKGLRHKGYIDSSKGKDSRTYYSLSEFGQSVIKK